MKSKTVTIAEVGAAVLPSLSSCSDKSGIAQRYDAIRAAEQVPKLMTSGVWDDRAFSLDSSVYDCLVEIDAERRLSPALAESRDSPDGKDRMIRLRKGAKFRDGSVFDSADLKFTIERTQDPAVGRLKAQDRSVLDSIDSPDPSTVVVHLKEVRPTVTYQLTDDNMALLSSSCDDAKLGEKAPEGTGPL